MRICVTQISWVKRCVAAFVTDSHYSLQFNILIDYMSLVLVNLSESKIEFEYIDIKNQSPIKIED